MSAEVTKEIVVCDQGGAEFAVPVDQSEAFQKWLGEHCQRCCSNCNPPHAEWFDGDAELIRPKSS